MWVARQRAEGCEVPASVSCRARVFSNLLANTAKWHPHKGRDSIRIDATRANPKSRFPRRRVASLRCGCVVRCALSKKQWAEPEVDWLPLSQAVFTFGLAEDRIASDLHDKPLYELTEAEMAKKRCNSVFGPAIDKVA